MAWITAIQADEFLTPNTDWDQVVNKDEVLKLATNRLEQLVFKDEPIDRVGFRYIDGESVSKVSGSADFLLDAKAGNFAYHALQGWTRGTSPGLDLVIYTPTTQVVFDVPHISSGSYKYERVLSFSQIQSLQSFGGIFGGTVILDATDGTKGMFSAFETKQATGIVDKFGDQIFFGSSNRRISGAFLHNGVNVMTSPNSYGVENVVLDGVGTRLVINEQGEEVEITVPEVLPGDMFTYQVKIINGFDKTMFLYVNDVLIGNPIFSISGQNKSRLSYISGASSGGDRHTYIRLFGSVINTEVPITIPIRLVGACALLAVEYSKFPPKFVGDNEYLENENDYNRMQDLPINVQAAVEPFLADYESVVDIDGVATTAVRGVGKKMPKEKVKTLEYT